MSIRDLLTNLSSEPDQVIFGWLERANGLCIRSLDERMHMVEEYIDDVERFVPIAYIGQL